MGEPQITYADEPETVGVNVHLTGAGTSAPVRTNNRNKYTVARSGVGVIKISFQDDPGPVYQGICGFCFGDATVANVAGWSVVDQGYTPRSGNTQAFVQFSICNATNVVADLAATSTLTVEMGFKQAPAVE